MDEKIDTLIAIMNGEWVSDPDRAAIMGRIPSIEQVREHVLTNADPAQAKDMADRAEIMVKVATGMKAKAFRPNDANLDLISKRFPGEALSDGEKDALCVMLAEPALPRTTDIDGDELMPPPTVLVNPDPPPLPPPAPPEAVDDDQDDPSQPEPTPAPVAAKASRFRSNIVDDSVPVAEPIPPPIRQPAVEAATEDDLPDWGQPAPRGEPEDDDGSDGARESTVVIGEDDDKDANKGTAVRQEFLDWSGPGPLQRNPGFILMRRQILNAFRLAASSDERVRGSGAQQLEVLPGILSDPDNFDLYGGYDACANGIRIIREFQEKVLSAQ